MASIQLYEVGELVQSINLAVLSVQFMQEKLRSWKCGKMDHFPLKMRNEVDDVKGLMVSTIYWENKKKENFQTRKFGKSR